MNLSKEVQIMAKEKCYFEGCLKEERARGLCNTHYERLRINGTTTLKPIHQDLTGVKFGKLEAIEVYCKKPSVKWVCKCECGSPENCRWATNKEQALNKRSRAEMRQYA